MGNDKVFDIKAHPNFNKRLHDDSWAQNEATQRQNEAEYVRRKARAQQAYDDVMSGRIPEDEDY